MASVGFDTGVPTCSSAFAGGDGNAIEDCPIGYYRFHFWKSDEEPREEQENWVSSTDATGPMCISLIDESGAAGRPAFVRLLVRTLFGAPKSIILLEEDILSLTGIEARRDKRGKLIKSISRHQIIGAALHLYMEHEKDQISALEDHFGALSIRTSSSVSSMASADLVRLFPSSRLHESYSRIIPTEITSMNDTTSQRSTTYVDTPPRKRFKIVSRINAWDLARSFSVVTDGRLPYALLEMDQALISGTCNVDAVPVGKSHIGAGKKSSSSWRSFCQVLGERLSASPSGAHNMAQKICGALSPQQLSEALRHRRCREDAASPDVHINHRPDQKQLLLKVSELVCNEWTYLFKLWRLYNYLAVPLGTPGIMPRAQHALLFGQIEDLLALHKRSFTEMTANIFCGAITDAFFTRCMYSSTDKILSEIQKAIFEDHRVALPTVISGLERLAKEKDLLKYSMIINDYSSRMDVIFGIRQSDGEANRILSQFESGNPSLASSVLCQLPIAIEQENTTFHTSDDDADPDEDRLRRRISIMSVPDNRNILGVNSSSQQLDSQGLMSPHHGGNRSQSVEDVMGAIFQQVMRYLLVLKEVCKSLSPKDPILPTVTNVISLFDERCACLDLLKEDAEAMQLLFHLQAGIILDCPADLPHPNRVLLCKTTFWEVERGSIAEDRLLTLFVFNDIVIGCRKNWNTRTRSKSGRLERRPSSTGTNGTIDRKGSPTGKAGKYTFLFRVSVADVGMHLMPSSSVRVRSLGGVKAYSLHLPGHTEVVGSSGGLVKLADIADSESPSSFRKGLVVRSQTLLVRKHQEKCAVLIEKLGQARKRTLLAAASTNHIYLHRAALPSAQHSVHSSGGDIWTRVYTARGYSELPAAARSRILLLYFDGVPISTECISEVLSSGSGECGEVDALLVVQAVGGAFRLHLRMKDAPVSSAQVFSSGNGPLLYATDAGELYTKMVRIVGQLQEMYPPFGPEKSRISREHLERAVEPYTRGLFRRMRELVSRVGRASSMNSSSSQRGSRFDVDVALPDESGSVSSVERTPIVFDEAFSSMGNDCIPRSLQNTGSQSETANHDGVLRRKSIVSRILGRMAQSKGQPELDV